MALARALYWAGAAVRETGLILDRMGMKLQGNYAFKEPLPRHRRVQGYEFKEPVVGQNVFVAPNASVIGQVKLGNKSSIWYGAVLRGDVNQIHIGEHTTVGDRVVVHVASDLGKKGALPTTIGDNVTIDSGAILHACTIENGAVIEAGAVVMDGAVIGKGAVIGAKALVTAGTQVPAGEFWEGSPAKFVRKLTQEEITQNTQRNLQTRMLAERHLEELDHPTQHLEVRKGLNEWYVDATPQVSPLDPTYHQKQAERVAAEHAAAQQAAADQRHQAETIAKELSSSEKAH